MRRDDRDDPFDELFREIERMMEEMMGTTGSAGNVERPGLQKTASTHVDVQQTDEEIRVIADLPGVEKADISLQCDGEFVTISATSSTREYDEKVRLPARVDPETGSATYNNGVLEVTFERENGATDISVN